MTTLNDTATAATRSDDRLLSLLRLFRYIAVVSAAQISLLWHRARSIRRRRRAERELRVLSDAVLKDIGIARTEIPWIVGDPSKQWRGGRHDRH